MTETTSSGTANTAAGGGSQGFSVTKGYRNYVLGLLLLVYIFNFVDRQILSILMQPIKEEFGLSDTQLGLLSGLAFAIFYTVLGIPIAKLADRGVRRTVIVVSLTVWSGMTALSGAAVGFGTLMLARIGVAVGEAGCSPPSHSLISDYFPPRQRATALSFYAMGVYIGIMIGFLAGGWINQFFGWRWAFVAVGLPGVVLAVIVHFTLREPPRGHSEGLAASEVTPSVFETIRFLWSRKSFRHMSVAIGLHSFAGYGVSVWNPSFFIRVHEMSSGEVGTWLGIITGVGAGAGSFLGGLFADRMAAKSGDARWYMWISAVATLVTIPLSYWVYLSPTPIPGLLMYIPVAFLAAMWTGPTYSMAQGMVSLRMRAVAAAVLLFVLNLIGLGLGPLVVGILSDWLQPQYGAMALGYAILAALTVANLWSFFHYMMSARTLRHDLARRPT